MSMSSRSSTSPGLPSTSLLMVERVVVSEAGLAKSRQLDL
jgi:hypothetical protein